MPLHLEDLDIVPEISSIKSVLIVPCNMCPAVTVAVREEKPFIQLFRSFLKSAPFEQYILDMQSRLKEMGVNTKVFKSNIPHQWFMCMWPSGQRRKLREYAKQFDAVIALGCDSATETVKNEVKNTNCKVIEGMKVTGFINSQLTFHFPCNISFENCKIVPISKKNKEENKKT